ncbi:MAG: DNA-3-methyladenine glycosylase 2 family protein [Bacteroidetes bacterium]|nr:DNA-3-methyladenine glycosylase 2 family protein [Bacteroidota bacterium]
MSRKRRLELFQEEVTKGTRLLSRRDPLIRPLVREHGLPTFKPHDDYFDTLVDSVISQQISGAAAASILRKLRAVLGGRFDPGTIMQVPDELIRGAGVSPQKLGYLRSLAEHVVDGRLQLKRIADLPDEEVITELIDVKGIGIWTVHMFMIFSLGRLDVLPTGDLGVKRGVQNLYGYPVLPTPKEVEEVAGRNGWAPYRSIASWYMWRAA